MWISGRHAAIHIVPLTDDLGYTDAELTPLAERLFGGTAWPDTLHLAIVTGEPAIVEQCRSIHIVPHHSRPAVRLPAISL